MAFEIPVSYGGDFSLDEFVSVLSDKFKLNSLANVISMIRFRWTLRHQDVWGSRGKSGKVSETPLSYVSFNLIPEIQDYETMWTEERRKQIIYNLYFKYNIKKPKSRSPLWWKKVKSDVPVITLVKIYKVTVSDDRFL